MTTRTTSLAAKLLDVMSPPSSAVGAAAPPSPTAQQSPSPSSSPAAQVLMQEISALELQILKLETYLLSLYRTAFRHHLPPLLPTHHHHHRHHHPTNYVEGHIAATQPNPKRNRNRIIMDDWPIMSPSLDSDFAHHNHYFPSRSSSSSSPQTPPPSCANHHAPQAAADAAASPYPLSLSATTRVDQHGPAPADDSQHRSLADHLGTSRLDYDYDSDALHPHPNKLSEQILRCICSIYSKFVASPPAPPPPPHKGFSLSSTSSSLSSSSTFSPRNISGSWSPQFNDESKGCCFAHLRDDTGPDVAATVATIQVLKIFLDDDSFRYAATMLQKFRSLVKNLENVDPSQMKREEKLAFWLNIHNALVMHGYLAYGTHNFLRSSSILKAAYNVGGHCINAHVIQSCILGVRSHYSAPWLQTFLSPNKKKKFTTGTPKHAYSLEYPEPLVYFALCSGSYSDPLVRVYTANSVFRDLKVARDEYIRARVYVHKESRVYLPKVVCYFAREMSLSTSELVEMVCACVSEPQRKKAVRTCFKGREDKCVSWIPQSSTFRFLIHMEVSKGDACSIASTKQYPAPNYIQMNNGSPRTQAVGQKSIG